MHLAQEAIQECEWKHGGAVILATNEREVDAGPQWGLS